MDTVCTMTLYGAGGEADVDAAFARVREVDARLSMWQEASEVSAVSRAAGSAPVQVSADTMAVLTLGLELSRISRGAFDITVGPLVKLWAIGSPRARVPSREEISRALAATGYGDLALSPANKTAYLARKGMQIDLGALAKGYAADEAARVLAGRGIKRALVNLGGNIVTLGSGPGRGRWKIGVQAPGKSRGSHVGILSVGATSVVTSGEYERYFESGGRRYHHIMDTATGYPAESGLAAVTIVGLPSVLADGAATLACILGAEAGRKMLESAAPGMNAVFVTGDHRVFITPGLRRGFTISDPSYTLAGW
jgi:FAD:protein FMN transferase